MENLCVFVSNIVWMCMCEQKEADVLQVRILKYAYIF